MSEYFISEENNYSYQTILLIGIKFQFNLMNKVFATIATASIAVGTATFITPEASAVTISLNGTDYEITTIEGSFNENQALLESQIWFNDGQLAINAANQVRDQLGFLPTNNISPIFALPPVTTTIVLPFDTFTSVSIDGYVWDARRGEVRNIRSALGTLSLENPRTFFVVEESEDVPEPLTILGTFVAGGIGFGLKKKKELS